MTLASDQELEEVSAVGRDRFTKSPEDKLGVLGTERKNLSSPKPRCGVWAVTHPGVCRVACGCVRAFAVATSATRGRMAQTHLRHAPLPHGLQPCTRVLWVTCPLP